MNTPFRYSGGRVSVDGQEINVSGLELTIRDENGDAFPGSCPVCARVLIVGEPIVCPHGVTVQDGAS